MRDDADVTTARARCHWRRLRVLLVVSGVLGAGLAVYPEGARLLWLLATVPFATAHSSEEGGTPLTTAEAPREVAAAVRPPLDLATPVSVQTATFALG